MFIKAELVDGEHVSISKAALDRLLERNLVRGFMRSSGWAVVGVHPIRASAFIRNGFSGRERRQLKEHLFDCIH